MTDLQERIARKVYDAMRSAAFDESPTNFMPPEWVEGGNSMKQAEARVIALEILDIVAEGHTP